MLGIIAYVDSGRREERKREIQILPQKVNQGCLIPFVHDADLGRDRSEQRHV